MRSHRVIAVLFAGVAAAACGGGDGNGGNGNNQDPVAAFTAPSCTVGVPCQFTDASSDPDGADDIVAWEWDFGDGATGTGSSIAHIYGNPGTYNVVLKVTDSAGKVGLVTKSITITAAPELP